MKICKRCNQKKPLSEFYVRKGTNQIECRCKECFKIINKIAREKAAQKKLDENNKPTLLEPPTNYKDKEGKTWKFVKEYPTYCRYIDELGFYSCFSKQELKMIKNKKKEAGPRLVPLLKEKII